MTGNGGLLAGIESGGTKFVLAVANEADAIVARQTIATRDPETTLAEAAAWFAARGRLRALGIASFGPLSLDPADPQYGRVLATPKPGWAGFDLVGFLRSRFDVPIALDTDVNGAAVGEHRYGAGKGGGSLAYITVGTGIGGGLVLDGKPVHGAAHPEFGHLFVPRHARDQEFPGTCPHHGACLEGLASGPAIAAR